MNWLNTLWAWIYDKILFVYFKIKIAFLDAVETLANPPSPEPDLENFNKDTPVFSAMSKDEVINWAAENGIPINPNWTKRDIIDEIYETLEHRYLKQRHDETLDDL